MIWQVNCLWFLKNIPLFTTIVIFYLKVPHSMKVLLVSSSHKYILTYAKKQWFYLDKKATSYPKMMELWIFLYALRLVHQYQWFDILCGWGIYLCPQSRMMDGWTDRQMHTRWQYPLAKGKNAIRMNVNAWIKMEYIKINVGMHYINVGMKLNLEMKIKQNIKNDNRWRSVANVDMNQMDNKMHQTKCLNEQDSFQINQ